MFTTFPPNTHILRPPSPSQSKKSSSKNASSSFRLIWYSPEYTHPSFSLWKTMFFPLPPPSPDMHMQIAERQFYPTVYQTWYYASSKRFAASSGWKWQLHHTVIWLSFPNAKTAKVIFIICNTDSLKQTCFMNRKKQMWEAKDIRKSKYTHYDR